MAEQALELSRKAAALFGERGIENARLEAELLLAATLGVRRLDLYLQFDRPLGADELERFRQFVRRRLRREPLQYIVGTAAFRKLELRVDRRVLIPRPETEQLVSAVLDWSSSRPGGVALDVGTGSGAIALSLAQEGTFEAVVATDASADALDVARENAARMDVTAVEFRCGSLYVPIRTGERYRVIVSNPPYIADQDGPALEPEVRDHEPHVALFAGADGMAVLGPIIDGAAAWLEPGGLLALEMGAGQADAVLAAVRSAGAYRDERVLEDLAGRPRIVLAVLAGASEQEGRS